MAAAVKINGVSILAELPSHDVATEQFSHHGQVIQPALVATTLGTSILSVDIVPTDNSERRIVSPSPSCLSGPFQSEFGRRRHRNDLEYLNSADFYEFADLANLLWRHVFSTPVLRRE